MWCSYLHLSASGKVAAVNPTMPGSNNAITPAKNPTPPPACSPNIKVIASVAAFKDVTNIQKSAQDLVAAGSGQEESEGSAEDPASEVIVEEGAGGVSHHTPGGQQRRRESGGSDAKKQKFIIDSLSKYRRYNVPYGYLIGTVGTLINLP